MMNVDEVIIVNEQDDVLGYMNKLEAHQKGILHRAISVFVFNSKGEWLMQQRASDKYHSSNLWSNSACSHPMRGESELTAAERRLEEEMGIKTKLKRLFSFQYEAKLDSQLVENELDHVFIGKSDDLPKINPEEVADYKYISTEDLSMELVVFPQNYTEWFKLLFQRVRQELE